MARMSSVPPPHIGNHPQSPPQLHPATTITTRHFPLQQHPNLFPQKPTHLHHSENLIRPLHSLPHSNINHTEPLEQPEDKNLYQWNAIISGYTKNGQWYDTMYTFNQFLLTDHVPDNFTLPCVIKACVGISSFGCGKVVHGMGVKFGLISDVFVGNSLVAMYGKFGFVEDAVRVFGTMPQRNLVTCNSLLSGFSDNGFYGESIDLFVELLVGEDGLMPDVATLVTVLPVCGGERDVLLGRMIHSLAVKLGLYLHLKVQNALMDMYVKCGNLLAAETILDKNQYKNVVSWNSVIWGRSKEGEDEKTFELLSKMQNGTNGVKPDEVTILNVLKVCLHRSQLLKVKELHGYSIRHGFESNELVANAFIAAYPKCECGLSSLCSAENVFNNMKNKTVSSWNALISGYTQSGDPSKAIDLCRKMTFLRFKPDWYTIGSLLLACVELKFLSYGKQTHGFVIRNGLETDLHIGNSLVSFYIHCDKPLSAKIMFDGLKNKNLVSWNTMIAGYSQTRLPNEALNLFRIMVSSGTQANEIAATSVLTSCSQVSALRLGQSIHCYVLKKNLMRDILINSSLIDMYAKTGCIKATRYIFDRSDKKHIGLWTVLIAAYGVNGKEKEAMELYYGMQSLNMKPDHFTFIAILTACNHGGLVAEGFKLFNEMQTIHGVEPKIEHYACLVDMLGRAKRFDDAMMLISKMPEEPDARMWSSLLSSCRVHGNIKLGKEIAEKLLQLEPNIAENYVLSSNLFASFGKWDNVRMIRQRMKTIGLKKEVGCSWIEIKGKVYNFFASDKIIPDIHHMWRRLEEDITRYGYKPDTKCVLHELTEDEKVDILRGHSEKLAVSFGMLQTDKSVTLRIFKNLRICDDCHNAIKLVSKAVDRKIIVRDNKRFHHFRNGHCSCEDYW